MLTIYTRDVDQDMQMLRRSIYGRSLGAELPSVISYLRSLDTDSYSAAMQSVDLAMAAYAMV
jgi:hypothetical protein